MLGAQCPKMSTTYNWVDTEAQLEHLARLLGEERAFAVDTEQHSIRSFLGYTALMQVITGRCTCTLNILFFISLLLFLI
jgi:cation-transporting P-type ATPase D